ncbi:MULTISPECIES: hypothetical protein [unclassified Pseudoalteromonas]|uniref:hypothetical protein n=1 Tax=unclassified Pseudoalteromonas TaxID=194690 RepID=UPI0005A8AE90|nr:MULTISPECIES: hypothetical protein [unclassified Pseudoalteromonas]
MHPFSLSKESIKKVTGANSIIAPIWPCGLIITHLPVPSDPPVMADDIVFIAPLDVRFRGEIVIN